MQHFKVVFAEFITNDKREGIDVFLSAFFYDFICRLDKSK